MHKQLLVALILCAGASSALAAPACNQQTTRGSWVATCEGTITPPGGVATPTRLLGTCDASKSGYWTCTGNVSFGAGPIPQTLQGQAYPNADCTGFISYTQTLGGNPAGTLDIDYVVSEGGTKIDGLPINQGALLSCSLKRID
jgi:hypothetical protein